MGIFDSFTTQNVLRASGITILIPSAVMIIAPAVIIKQVFGKASEDSKEELLGRSAGIAGASSALMQLAVPGRDVLHIAIGQAIACTVVSGKWAKDVDDDALATKNTKNIAKVLCGLDALVLIALLIGKKNDDEDTGKPWHKILP